MVFTFSPAMVMMKLEIAETNMEKMTPMRMMVLVLREESSL